MIKTGAWKLKDIESVPKNGLKVLSCFSCAGGSTMGYKLAGYDVIGCVEIDPKMMAIYKENHKPKYPFLMGVQDFKNIKNEDLPTDLFNLDILDGSPPCSVFSTAGAREKKWGGEFHFAEGQAKQRLDDLFFDFIDVAEKLKPKVVVAENVTGLIKGKARFFVNLIFKRFREAGYTPKLFLLNSSFMGVPQKRERVFFIAIRNDIDKTVSLKFNETPISCRQAFKDIEINPIGYKYLTSNAKGLWLKVKPGKSFATVDPKGNGFGQVKVDPTKPAPTVIASGGLLHWSQPRELAPTEILRLQTFPDDFKAPLSKIIYICGMSVPPFMTQRIALEIARQVFNKDSTN